MANQIHTFSVGEDYIVPSWSGKSQYKYFLEIIKNGVPIEEKDISYKPFILLGKYQDLCDVVLEHPTISRKHAIIQHKPNGELFLYDLGSSHGSFVNNKRLPSKVYHKLNPFDSIKFASSTRIYILRCIEIEEKDQEQQLQEESINNKKVEQNKVQSDQSKEVLGDEKIRTPKELKDFYLNLRDNDPYYKQVNKKNKLTGGPSNDQKEENKPKDSGISWGMSDEQEVYDYQDESQIALVPDLLRRLPNLNEKQVEKIEKYEERLNKYRQAEQELEELNAKERKEYGLEEKLKVRKEKVQAKMIELQTTLDQAEANVRLSLFNESDETEEIKKKRAFSKFDNNNPFDDDDDDFFDRTKSSKKVQIDHDERKKMILKKLENTTENFWGLKKKLEKLIEERHEYNRTVLELNSSNAKKDNQDGDDDEDELDAYMKQTNDNLNKETREKLFAKIRELNNEIDLVSDMLKYIKPDTQIDYEQYEKNLDKVFDNGDEDDDSSFIKKNSIIKEDKKLKQDKVAQELSKLRELKQRKIEQDKILSGDNNNKEISEEAVLKAYSEQLQKMNKYEQQEDVFQKYQEEYGNEGEDAPVLVGQGNNKKVYQVAQKPASRNLKGTKEKEAIVDLTYMETMENYNEIYNNEMSKKYGY